MATLMCVKTLQTKHITFREGETYDGNKVNDTWWSVDAVGVKNEDINTYFINKEEKEKELDIVTKE